MWPWRLITAAIPGDTAAIPSDSGRSPVPSMTHDRQYGSFSTISFQRASLKRPLSLRDLLEMLREARRGRGRRQRSPRRHVALHLCEHPGKRLRTRLNNIE